MGIRPGDMFKIKPTQSHTHEPSLLVLLTALSESQASLHEACKILIL